MKSFLTVLAVIAAFVTGMWLLADKPKDDAAIAQEKIQQAEDARINMIAVTTLTDIHKFFDKCKKSKDQHACLTRLTSIEESAQQINRLDSTGFAKHDLDTAVQLDHDKKN